MTPIICSECSAAPYGALPNGFFRCDNCAHEIARSDIDPDGSETWAVDSAGTLVIVTDPAVSAEWAREALADYLDDEPGSYGEAFDLNSFSNAIGELLDAARVGLPVSRLI